MPLDREACYAALFERLRKLPGVVWPTRELVDFDQINNTKQPALIMVATSQRPENSPGRPAKWTLEARVLVIFTPNQGEIVDARLNAFVTGVEGLLERQPSETSGYGPGGQTTLDGLVQYAWISDVVELYQGEGGDQAFAVIPIEMLVP